MKGPIRCFLLGVFCLALAATLAQAEVLTVDSILTAQKAGAPSDGIIAMIDDPSNTVGMSAGDLVTLRGAGVSEDVIAAVWARVPAPTPTPQQLVPDEMTPVDQGNNKADLATTAKIRKEIMASTRMSVNAQNVKVITNAGKVTLRGPVDTATEKRLIGEIAVRCASGGNVDNQLEVLRSVSSS